MFIPFISSLKKSGQVLGMGNVKPFIATPYATARGSTYLQGTRPVRSSHNTTPKLKYNMTTLDGKWVRDF